MGGSQEDTVRKRRFREEQIIGVLKAAEAGMAVKEVCRQHGGTEATNHRWKKKSGGRRTCAGAC